MMLKAGFYRFAPILGRPDENICKNEKAKNKKVTENNHIIEDRFPNSIRI